MDPDPEEKNKKNNRTYCKEIGNNCKLQKISKFGPASKLFTY